MVTLSILKYLENNGFGAIDQDLFWEKMGLGENGIYISSLGGDQSREIQPNEVFELYCRAETDVECYQKLQKVADFLTNSYTVCNLPAVPPASNWAYRGVSFAPMSAISKTGMDTNGRVIFSVTGRVYYSQRVFEAPPASLNRLLTESGVTILTEGYEEIITEEVE